MNNFITIKQWCDLTGCSRALYYKEVKANRLKTCKIGGKIVIRKRDYEAWESNLEAENSAPQEAA